MTGATEREPWLPRGFLHPVRVELTVRAYTRPIRGEDTEFDYRAVMGYRERLWNRMTSAWPLRRLRYVPEGLV